MTELEPTKIFPSNHCTLSLEEMYQSAIHKGAFNDAYRIFPRYNDMSSCHHEAAVILIKDWIEKEYRFKDKDGILDEMISAGLS